MRSKVFESYAGTVMLREEFDEDLLRKELASLNISGHIECVANPLTMWLRSLFFSPQARLSNPRKKGQAIEPNPLIELDGGSAWESNPPARSLAPHTGFEVREPHQ